MQYEEHLGVLPGAIMDSLMLLRPTPRQPSRKLMASMFESA